MKMSYNDIVMGIHIYKAGLSQESSILIFVAQDRGLTCEEIFKNCK